MAVSSSNPRLAHICKEVSSFNFRTILQTFSISATLNRLPEHTKENLFTPSASFCLASSNISSYSKRGYTSQLLSCLADWAHHAQSSLHFPLFALTMEHISNLSELNLNVISFAAASKAVKSAEEYSHSASSSLMQPPASTLSLIF